MKILLFLSLNFILISSSMALDVEFEPTPALVLGIRGGTNADINQSPAPYASLKMTHYSYGSSSKKTHFLVPGIGVQSAKGSTKINLSIAPVMFEGNQGWSFGVDLFNSLKNSSSGQSSYGFFIGKTF